MKIKILLLVLLVSVAMLGIVASPASAAYSGLPHVATPEVAHLYPFDGAWWSGGYGWAGFTAYQPGAPIPAQKYVIVDFNWMDPDKALVERLPQVDLYSLTVRAANGVVVVKTTEAQSAQYWSKVTWMPTLDAWYRVWAVPLGQLPAGTYQVTVVDHLITTIEGSLFDEATGTWYPAVIAPCKDTYRSSFTVQ